METLDSVLVKAKAGDKVALTQLARLRPIWDRLSKAQHIIEEQKKVVEDVCAKLTG